MDAFNTPGFVLLDHLMPNWLFWSLLVLYVVVGSWRRFRRTQHD